MRFRTAGIPGMPGTLLTTVDCRIAVTPPVSSAECRILGGHRSGGGR
jgi:hypothetical protein